MALNRVHASISALESNLRIRRARATARPLQGPGRTARHATTRERGIVFADHTRTHAKKDCPSAQTRRMLKSSHRPPQRNCSRTPLSNSVTLPSSWTSSARSCSTPTRPDHASVSAGDLVTDGPRPDHTSVSAGFTSQLSPLAPASPGHPWLTSSRTQPTRPKTSLGVPNFLDEAGAQRRGRAEARGW